MGSSAFDLSQKADKAMVCDTYLIGQSSLIFNIYVCFSTIKAQVLFSLGLFLPSHELLYFPFQFLMGKTRTPVSMNSNHFVVFDSIVCSYC